MARKTVSEQESQAAIHEVVSSALKEAVGLIVSLRTLCSFFCFLVSQFHQVVFPIMSGVFGAQSVLLGKAIAEIAASVIDGGNAMGRWQTYLFLIGVGCTVGLQLHTMAHGLRRASSVITVPTFQVRVLLLLFLYVGSWWFYLPLCQCTHVTWSIIAGAVYYHELAGFESWQVGLLAALPSCRVYDP